MRPFNNSIDQLRHILFEKKDFLKSKKITVGFDGFIDSIVRVIKSKEKGFLPSLFKQIDELGAYILEKSDKSFSLELEKLSEKLGGNMPLMANALAQFKVEVNCIGALGHPNIHTKFKSLPSNCRLYSFADPGISTSLEFDNGKIMLSEMCALNSADWATIKGIIGLETLIPIFQESDLLCLLNWSELEHSTEIWKGVLKEVLPAYNSSRKQTLFIDLADCSKRSNAAIREVVGILADLTKCCRVVLSLNKNEAQLIYKVLFDEVPSSSIETLGEKIFPRLSADTLLIHTAQASFAFEKSNLYSCPSFFVEHPKILTGAGDNFNAGYCLGLLLEVHTAEALLLANALSGYYVKEGNSPTTDQITDFLEGNLNKG